MSSIFSSWFKTTMSNTEIKDESSGRSDAVRMMKAKFDKVDMFMDQRYDKIKKNLTEKKSVFHDVFFPPSYQTLGPQANHLINSVEWKRPMELSGNPRLFDTTADVTVIRRGELSSNWIVSAFSLLACLKELCYKIIPHCRDQEWDTEAVESYTGIFCFRFWRFGQWVEVVVDDLLPVVNGKLIYTHSNNPDEFWVSLLEKAYAKLSGSYDALEEGHIADALVDMTGGVSETIDLKSGDYETNEDLRAELFHMLSSEMADHTIMCALIPIHSQDEIGQRTEVGLLRGHAYLITAVKRIHLGESKIRNLLKGREKVSMVRLRDPHGSFYNKANYDSPNKSINSNPESDSEYAFTTSHLTRLLSRNPAWAKIKESEKSRIGLDIQYPGEFWMPLEDFVSNLGELTLVRLYNNNFLVRGRKWKESALEGCWSVEEIGSYGGRSGGGNISSDTFLNNPQFCFDVQSEEYDVIIQMLQWKGKESGSVASTPGHNPRRTLLIGFNVIRVEENRKYRLHKLWPFYRIVITVDHQRRRELCYRGRLPKGRYLLVPTTYKPGCEGFFLIRLISETEIHLRLLRRDLPKKICTLSCISKENATVVTVVCLKSAIGIAGVKNVYCSIKCEQQKVKSRIIKANKEIEWDEEFIFYRKSPERPITIKVYSHNICMRDKVIGWAEVPAPVNHGCAPLEVTLMNEDSSLLENTVIRLKVFTEDNLQLI